MTAEKRRLAAIMVADIVAFSSLMERDESGTFDRVRTLREQLIMPRIRDYGGRMIKTTGDGFLAEFPSATSALRCAVEMQRANHAQEASRPAADRIRMRIGLNVGDIIADGDDIAGDGVIIAARLEPLAPPDGICVSGTVREHIRQDLGIEYLDLGDQQVKNISRPIRAYRVDLARTIIPGPRETELLPSAPLASTEVTDRYLSVVVLPFANRTGDPEQEYVSDGITEYVTMDLSRIRDAFIVSAATAHTYKGKPASAQQLGKELGVRFVMQGSVQRSGTRIRIAAQLADTASGAQLWAETFDGDQSDLFALQDQVTTRLANSIGREIVINAAREALTRRSHPKAADLMLHIRARFLKSAFLSLEEFEQIEALCRDALTLEPNHPGAMGFLAVTLTLQASNFGDQMDPDVKEGKYLEGKEIAVRARELDTINTNAYMAIAMYAKAHDDYAGYRRAVEASVALNPKIPNSYINLASALLAGGEARKAIEALDQAISLDPKHPFAHIFSNMSWAHFMLGDNGAAIEWALKLLETSPASHQAYAVLAMSYAMEGDDERSRSAADNLRRLNPAFALKSLAPGSSRPAPYRRYFEERLAPAWRKAGLPE